ncbi:MAG: hypothetical protein H0X44_04985 [Acidobacteria bacterium]|nr:hypothetical protein [Acidobacteriota bacterium]
MIGTIAALALSLQLCSLVFPAWIEEVQLGMQTTIDGVVMMPDGRFDHFVIGQRVRNIVDAVAGTSTTHPPILLVAMPLQTFPPWAAMVVRVGWCALALALVWYSRRLLRGLARAS